MKTRTDINRFEIRLSGLGGQGIITLGKVMGYGLAIGHGYYVTQTQSYGPEARGGSSRADLVVSSNPISYPKTQDVDLLVALSQEACNNYYRVLKNNGVLLIDTSMVQTTPTNVFIGLPFTTMAKEKIGLPQTLNTIVLGAIAHLLPFADRTTMRKSMEENLPAKIVDINIKAFNLGHAQAKKEFGDAGAVWESVSEIADDEENEEHV